MLSKRLTIIAVITLLAGVGIVGCSGGSADHSAQYRQLVDKYVAAYNNHDIDEVARLYDANAMLLYSDSPTPRFGRQQVIDGLNSFFIAFPDVRMDYSFFMSDSTFFCIEATWKGTQTGPLQSSVGPVPPTGRTVEMRFAMIAEVSPEGLIVSDRGYYNVQDFIRQLFPKGMPRMTSEPDTSSKKK